MKPVAWMIGVSTASWLAVAALAGVPDGLAILPGMLGPLVVASGMWVLMARTYRRDPVRLTPLMMTAFAGKLLFFGVYVAVMLRVLMVRPVPFVASFAAYFIALHVMEAVALRRLFTS